MDETTFWRHEFTSLEVEELYACGKPHEPLHVGLPTKVADARWRMGEWRDGSPFLGILEFCYDIYPVTKPFRNAFWNNPVPERIREDTATYQHDVGLNMGASFFVNNVASLKAQFVVGQGAASLGARFEVV